MAHAEPHHPGLRQRAHAHLQRAAPYGMPAARASRPRTSSRSSSASGGGSTARSTSLAARSARSTRPRRCSHGTTTLIDHHESPDFIEGSLDVLADACQELGIRAVLCYGATDRNGGRDEARRGLAECRRFPRANRRPLVAGWSACTRRSPSRTRRCAKPASWPASSTPDSRARGRGPRRCGGRPPARLRRAARAAAHGGRCRTARSSPTACTSSLRRSPAGAQGLWLVQNPRSNEGNRVGYASSLWASDKVALGTDGWEADIAREAAALTRLGADGIPEEIEARQRPANGRRWWPRDSPTRRRAPGPTPTW